MQLNVTMPGTAGISLTAISFAQVTEFMQFLAATAGFAMTCIALWNWYQEKYGSRSGARSGASSNTTLPVPAVPPADSEKK